jgi:hypothetical protein
MTSVVRPTVDEAPGAAFDPAYLRANQRRRAWAGSRTALPALGSNAAIGGHRPRKFL